MEEKKQNKIKVRKLKLTKINQINEKNKQKATKTIIASNERKI